MLVYITLVILILALLSRGVALFIYNERVETMFEVFGYAFTFIGLVMLFCVCPIVCRL